MLVLQPLHLDDHVDETSPIAVLICSQESCTECFRGAVDVKFARSRNQKRFSSLIRKAPSGRACCSESRGMADVVSLTLAPHDPITGGSGRKSWDVPVEDISELFQGGNCGSHEVLVE